MDSNSTKYFAPITNYGALREQQEMFRHKPTQEETRSFLNFWQEVYDFWKTNYSPFDFKFTEEKIKIRKSFIEKLGIRP